MQQKIGTLLTLNQRVTIHENLIKFLTKSLESSFCDYSNAYILVTGNIIVEGSDNIQKLHLNIVHHSENVEQKSMILLLTKQNN